MDYSSIDSSLAPGMDYESEQFSFDSQPVKPCTILEASLVIQWDDMLFCLNINNLFDKEYAVSGFGERNGHFAEDPEEVIAQITYNF